MLKNKLLASICFLLILSINYVFAQSPGGVSTGLQTWLKANTGVTGATPITAWTNQQAAGTAILVNGSPNLNTTSTSYNYNPYIDFTAPVGTLSDGLAANRQFLRLSGFSGVAGINYTGLFFVFHLNDLSRTYTHLATVENVTNSTPANGTFHGDANGATASILLEAYDITDFGTSSPAGTWQRNGTNIASNSNHSSTKHLLSTNCMTGGSTTLNTFLGGQRDLWDPNSFAGHFRDWRGPVGEIIGYTSALSVADRQKVDSYLGVKYGLTLSHNYLNTSGGTIFTVAAPYNNNIIGIGRDDAEALNQKQSHYDNDLVRVFLGTLAAMNVSNASSFTLDNSYVLMGDNNGAHCATAASNAEMPIGLAGCTLFSRLEKEWKVQRTNMAQNYNMSIALAACGAPGSVNTAHLRLLVDDDGNFANGGTQCYYIGDGTGINFTYANPYITVQNISTTHIPNNTTKYVTIASIDAATPLPVELLLFDAQIIETGRYVDLIWTTGSEINSKHFEIYKSTDLTNWEWLENIPAAGNSAQSLDYKTIDYNPYSGLSYYRLNMINSDGSSSQSEVRSVKLSNDRSLNIYPNPANDFIVVSGYNQSMGHLFLTNTLGQQIPIEIVATSENGVVVSTINLSSGLYYMNLALGTGNADIETKPLKFIVE